MARRPQILVTNDDGIDSLGLYALARAVAEHADVMVVAPDQEFSGASSAIGSIADMKPEAHRRTIADLPDEIKVWAVSGPPALCVLFVRMGAFDFEPDLVVSGINPGANIGRSVYHSGTVGACLTGRNGGVSGIAVSQALQNWDSTGQSWNEAIAKLDWSTAATLGAAAAKAMLETPPAEPQVLNMNVPDKPLAEIDRWSWTKVSEKPPAETSAARLESIPGHTNSFDITVDWGTKWDGEEGSDVHAISQGELSLSWIGKMTAHPDNGSTVGTAVDRLLG
ncbi:MAG: 5'/3'-nucleotidase SurE [Acidimicrobiia bacterium]|nr:5'/3'-nucleotidase SurE [Acidimicrobiia bacterium]